MITPIILSGGSGTRLWPLSRSSYPKQFLPLTGEDTMLQATVDRARGDQFAAPLIVCNEEHRFLVAEQLRAAAVEPQHILLEPDGRNTAPAAALAAMFLTENHDDALMLVMPSDHVIKDADAFVRAIEHARPAAQGGSLVTFGIKPNRPETGYGYIKFNEQEISPHVHGVEQFLEKPGVADATRFVESGDHLWNSGIFLFRASAYLAELQRYHPDIVNSCERAFINAEKDLTFCRLDAAAFMSSPSDSIDYAVMEHTDHAAVVPVEMAWSDVGTWLALWEVEDKDAACNVVRGDTLTHDTTNSYIRSEGMLVATAGVSDLVVVATDDAVLVADRNNTQDVKLLVDRIKAEGRDEHNLHTEVHRPWGSYCGIDKGERYQVKRITVNPGAQLSLQMHYHRAEHWIVVCGTARVTHGDSTFLLRENESTYISLGETHRLENPGKVPLHLIEVQSGAYLGEDDIVRFEDGYGRIE